VVFAVNRAALLANRGEAGEGFFAAPQKELRDRLFNYGASLIRGNREEEALRWGAYAGERYPDEGWQDYIFTAVNNRIVKLSQAGRFAEAGDFLETARPLLSNGNFRRADLILTDTELSARANKLSAASEGEGLLAAVGRAEAEGRLGGDRAAELRNFAILKTAELLSLGSASRRDGAGRDWLAGIAWMEQAQSRYGRDSRIEREIENYRSNRAAEFHNRFAAAFNRRNMEEARRILDEALAEFPDNRQLLSDRNTLDRMR
jgi:tetratricopeptide (TPR) repeat protein